MRQAAKRGTVSVGIIGAGPLWERRYRPALRRLAPRISVAAVYDAVLMRAHLLASEVGAEAVCGLRQLYERPDVQAILVLDPAWFELAPAELACEYQKPAFLAGSLGADLLALQSLRQQAEQAGATLMTEFSRRHSPATGRLRELIATRLGPARGIRVRAALACGEQGAAQNSQLDFLVGMLDWCAYVAGRTPIFVRAAATAATPADPTLEQPVPCRIELGFRPDSQGQPQIRAEIEIERRNAAEVSGDPPTVQLLVECEHGTAAIPAPAEIEWRHGSAAERESLATERSDAEVMLDQFSRRVLGGLVPVADLNDACRGIFLAQAALRSLQSGEMVGTAP